MSTPCDDVRTSLSAHVDGEDAPLSIAEVDGHLGACADCTAFAAGLSRLDERVAAFRAAVPVEDRTADVLAAAGRERRQQGQAGEPAHHGPSVPQLRGLLGLAAAVQLVLAVTTLAGFGGDHLVRDLAAFELAAGGGLAAAAWRPPLAAGMLPVIAVAAVFGAVTMVGDAIAGTSTVSGEIAHLVLLVATWPLVALARRHGPTGTVETR